MKKLIERLLIFIIGLPAVIALVLFLPFLHNLAMNIAVIILSGIGAVEFSAMLKSKQINISKAESFILGAAAPMAMTLNVSFGCPEWIITGIIMTGALWAVMSGVFSRSSEIQTVLNKVIGSFSMLIYPGFFMLWVVRMNLWENNYATLLFLFLTFACDSLAWLFGTLFGENNRGIIAVSPNKSIAGFIGGLLGPVILALCAALFFPFIFPFETSVSSLLLTAAGLGFCTGIAAVFGDLAESAIKRSSDFKDSGNIMLGRGGILDSIDSIAAAAPVFYLLFNRLSLIL